MSFITREETELLLNEIKTIEASLKEYQFNLISRLEPYKTKAIECWRYCGWTEGSHPYPKALRDCMGKYHTVDNIGWYLMEYEDALLMRMVKEGRISIIQECKENEIQKLNQRKKRIDVKLANSPYASSSKSQRKTFEEAARRLWEAGQL